MRTKYFHCFIPALTLLIVSCSEEKAQTNSEPANNEINFKDLCEFSGGTIEDNRCTCDGTQCNLNIVCDKSTGQCANTSVISNTEPALQKCEANTPDTCSVNGEGKAILKKCFGGYLIEEECESGCNSAGTNCSVSFTDLCESSGGRISDDEKYCVCNGITCPEGDFCVSNDTEMVCASDILDGNECTDGDTKCVNGPDDRGETYTCIDGKWLRDKDEEDKDVKCDGSCDRQMKQCGQSGCINYTIECKNDLLPDESGAIAQCQFGEWIIFSECANGVSCQDDNNCGECKNGSTKCEDHDVDGVMNKNCNAKGECEKDANGKVKYYPANIGILLLCDNGKWSDPNDLTKSMYCPEVEGTFQKYQNGYLKFTTLMTWINLIYHGALVHNDYHYSSCTNTKDGTSKCGSCNNHFNICSDEEIGGKPQGHIYKCENGTVVSVRLCTNKTCNSTQLECN